MWIIAACDSEGDGIWMDKIEAAYLKGRRDMADEIKEIFLKSDINNQYEIDMQMLDKLFEELNNTWCK